MQTNYYVGFSLKKVFFILFPIFALLLTDGCSSKLPLLSDKRIQLMSEWGDYRNRSLKIRQRNDLLEPSNEQMSELLRSLLPIISESPGKLVDHEAFVQFGFQNSRHPLSLCVEVQGEHLFFSETIHFPSDDVKYYGGNARQFCRILDDILPESETVAQYGQNFDLEAQSTKDEVEGGTDFVD